MCAVKYACRPALGFHEIETAVDDGQPRFAEQFSQRLHADQGFKTTMNRA